MINTNLDIIIIHMLNYFWVWVDLAETPQCQLLSLQTQAQRSHWHFNSKYKKSVTSAAINFTCQIELNSPILHEHNFTLTQELNFTFMHELNCHIALVLNFKSLDWVKL